MTRRGKKRLFILISAAVVLGAATTAGYFLREARRAQQIADAYRDGMTAYEAGDYVNALRGLGKSLSEHRTDPEVLYRIADARRHVPLENLKHITSAISFAREATTRAPEDQRPLKLLLELYPKVGFVTEDLEAANRLLALDPKNYDALVAKVQCLNSLGKSQEARDAIKALLDVRPEDALAIEMYVEAMRLDGVPSAEILEYVASKIEQSRDDVRLATLQMRTLAGFGKRDEAVAVAEHALTLEIPTTVALLDLVRTLDLLGLRGKADAVLDKAVQDDLFRDDVFAMLIERAWKAGQTDRAREQAAQYSKSLADTPTDLLGWITLATLPAENGWAETDSGRELAKRTDDVAPYWHGVLAAQEMINRRDYAAARKQLDETLRSDQPNGLAYSLMGEVCQHLGESDRAVVNLQQAVSMDPSSSRSQMMLATSLLDLGRLDEASMHAERAVMANPGAPEALTLARIYIALLDAGRTDDRIATGAVGILEEMASQAPDEPDVQTMLARAYVATGDIKDASEVIDRLSKSERLPTAAVLLDLTSACRRSAPNLVEPLLALSSRLDSTGPGLMAIRMAGNSSELKPEEVKARYKAAIEASTDPAQKMQYEIGYARYLDAISDAEALPEFKRIAESYTDQPEAQRALLDSRAAWTDEGLISATIDRLKAITGDNGSHWRLADAQRQLNFHPGSETASIVVNLLGPLTLPPSPNVKALMLSSDARLMLDDREGAIKMLLTAIDRQPGNALLFAHTIDLLQASGRSVEASQRLRQFLAITELDPSLQRQRIDQLSRQAMWSDAIRDCESLVARTEDSKDQRRLAILYAGHARTDDARKLFNKLLAAPTVDSDTRIAAADFFAVTEGLDKGLEILKPLELQVDATEYTKTLGSFYERRNRLADAAALYTARAESSNSGDDWAALVEFQVRNQQIAQARESIKKGLAADGTNESLLALNSLLDSLQSGQLSSESIEGILNALVDESIRPAMTQLAAAMQYSEANPNDAAGYIKKLRAAVDDQPSLILGWQLLATALMGNGQTDEAVTAAQRAAVILPSAVRSAELLATTLADADRLDEARLATQRWHDLDANSLSRSDLLLAQIEQRTGHPDRALAAIDPWVQRIQDEADRFPSRLGLYASILIDAGRTSEAHDLVWPRAQTDPNWAQIYVRLAAGMQDSPKTAIEWVDRAQPLIPLTADSRAGLAQIRMGLAQQTGRDDQYEKVVDLLQPMAKDANTPGPTLALLASAYQQLNDLPQAEAMYRAALKASPEDPVILNNLAYLLLQSDSNSQEAMDLAQRAAAGARDGKFPSAIRANLLDTLGSAQIQIGDFSAAQNSFRQGLNLDAQSVMLRLGLAEALARSGSMDEARSEFTKVTSRDDLNLGNADLRARRDRVEKLLK